MALKSTKKLVLTFVILCSFIGFSQEYTPFTRTYPSGNNFRYQTNIKGDLTIISNQILNRETGAISAETPYNNQATNNNNNPETGGRQNYNDFKNMQYINVDPAPDRFSSSTTTLTFAQANCNLIRYAALYWSATYPSATANGSYDGITYTPNTVLPGTGRQNDWNQVKFRVPGGTYVDITADEVLFDGFQNNATDSNSPYACYADVTSLVSGLTNPQGDYTVANIRATTGTLAGQGGSSGGWTLVIVYENPTLSGKLITTFDGFARVTGTNTVPITYSGFTTIPVGPVRAAIGVAALEGDFRIGGDGVGISTPTNPIFSSLSNAANPPGNFFNSNITLNGAQMPGRNPSSLNTLGFDADIFALSNPANSVIANNETSATFRFNTVGDQFYPYFNSFNIEIIEPNIVLEKRVEDIAGNDITGLGVNLGQILDYVLSFENTGNDDATNYTIRDILPLNVTLDPANITMPPGTTYTYDSVTREVVFTVPDDIIEIGDPWAHIRMRVQVAENCFDFIDACTDLIQNLAYSTYEGVINNNQITDDPSVSNFDSCGFTTPGATNFLLDDLSDCNFTRTVQLCGADALLDAGDNFDSYVWVRDDNNNGLLDATDTVQNDGDPDGDPSTLLVTQTGTYIVDKIVADPCKGFKEIITVERFGTTQTNPLVDFFNDSNGDADPTNDIQGEIVQCSVDGDLLPKIFLCGTNDSQLLQINIPDADNLSWELLDETSCPPVGADCANKNLTCTWNQVGTGGDFTANTAGKYRLVINYANGCFSRFYFDVYQNLLDVQYDKRDIFCTTNGNITITNLGANYGYQLLDVAAGTVLIPFSANNGPSFDINTNGAYRVDVVQLDGAGNPIPGACVFSTPDIGILNRDFQVNVATTPANCNAQGTIKIDILNVRPNYTYVLRLADGTLVDDETAQTDNTHTFNVNPGNYIVEASTADGCTFSQAVTVADTPDPTVLAVTTRDIGCTAGMITLTGSNGFPNPDYSYAIWSFNGATTYTGITDVPASEYQSNPVFTFGWRDTDNDPATPDQYIPNENGDYVFVIVDSNNCFAFSNTVTINDNGAMTATATDDTPVSCSGESNASITINTSGGIGPFNYSIDGGATTQPSPTFVNLAAGTYNIQVSDSSGCTLDFTHDIIEPFPFSASAGISRDATCDPMGAEVRITNVVGGTAPYQYSFDGGTSYGSSTIAILPAGTYNLIVRDASGCTFPMTVTVEDVPPPPLVTLTPEVSYLCDGTAVVTATPNIATYNYTFSLDGVINTPPDSNVFTNVAPGTYTVSTTYVSQTPPTPSLLLSEDFGYGLTIPNPNTSSAYYYENQLDDTTPSGAPNDSGRYINDYEYAVTSNIERPFRAWLNPSPIDHTTNDRSTGGRYLAVNLGDITDGETIYKKPINDIIPNQPLEISLWAINLVGSSWNRADPNLRIELRHPTTNALVASANTGRIPESNSNTDWIEYVLPLNPGANTSLNLVITSIGSAIAGCDVAFDDITVYQTPEVCALTVQTSVVVEAGRVFTAGSTGTSNVSCNGLTDGAITFETENFDAVAGFEYSLDGGSTYINSTISPVTTPAIYGVGTHTILLRKTDEPSCTTSISADITEPSPVLTSASITEALNCTNGGATITASATGGTPTYIYQLEDAGGTAITGFDFATNGANTVFTGLAAGDYIVRARDNNLCEDPIDTALTIAPTNSIAFDISPTLCYSGANDASIQVNVTDGNGGYTFSINGGPWITPTPTNTTSYTFDNLANGNYTINVSDASGCIGVPQNISINPVLSVSATAPTISACATDADITITATGGDANYVYAVVSNGTAVVDGDFSTTNPVTGIAAGTYDVYVRDNAGAIGYCEDAYAITINQDAPIAITPTPTPVTCFGGTDGAINIVVDSGGEGPFEYSIDGGTTYQVGTAFVNLAAGTYPVQVRDANGCETIAQDVVVNEPTELIAEVVQTQDYACNQLGQITVGSITPTSGGSGDYQYSINGGAWTASTTGGHTFSDLIDGAYSIRVRDANAISCETTLADIIIAPLPVEPVLASAITYNCDGTGEITITPFDTTYTYILDGVLPGQTGAGANVLSNVVVGNHVITVNYGSDCTIDIPVIVEPGHAFEASITTFENLKCNADNSGTITITASNFGAGGYEYSLDAATFVGPFTAAEQITGLAAGAYTITIRDVDNPIAGCTTTLNQTLTEPTPVVATASITDAFTCSNTGAAITANATGGTPIYQYQLEDNVGGIITAYQTPATFTNVPAGDYIVKARDTNGCDDPIDTVITIVAPQNPIFTATPTACYSGANDGSIVVDVTTVPGNGGFQFSINSGPWMTPAHATATTYTFDNLANGTYTIDVRDAFGCAGAQLPITLDPQLTATIDVVAISNCADGSITVNASGGDGNFAYAFVAAGTAVTAADFGAANTFAVAPGNDGDYDVYVWDNNAVDPHCQFVQTVTIDPATPIAYTATPTDPACYNGVGTIEVNITSGDSPYTIQIIDLDNGGASDQTNTNVVATTQSYFNLAPGNYTINVTDANACVVTDTPVTINNPNELTATIAPILPAACGSVDPLDYGFRFVGYPTTYPPGTTIEFSADGGTTWSSSDTLMGYISGTSVFPSMRTVVGGVEICRTDLPRYIIPFPLDDLDISISTVVVGCNELQVTVQGTAGVPNYEYAYTDNPSAFDITTAAWTAPTPGAHTWIGLIPGRTYVFYVRDSTGCVRQSNVNVNDITTDPIEISATYEPSCSGLNDAEITYTLIDTGATAHPSMRWEFYNVNTGALVQSSGGPIPTATTITVSGLAPAEYYIVVTEVDAGGADACLSASENLIVEELNPITATLNKLNDISCNAPGLISAENIQGGGGTFTFSVTGPAPFATITATSDNPIAIPANSPAGAYNVIITDQYGCFTDLGPVNLLLTPNPTIDSMVVDNCASPTSLTINASSTAAQVLYSIDGGATYVDNAGVFNNVAVGNYAISIIDSNGCTDTDTIAIYPVLEAQVSLTKLLDCTASPDAEITIEVTFGSGNYDYQITNGAGTAVAKTALPSNPFVFNATVAEDYIVTIYDNNTTGPCNRIFPITVPPAVSPAFTEVHTDVTCNTAADGTITLSETLNGINPLTYSISPAAGTFNTATSTFENLPPNTYTVTGTGSNNCSFDITGIIIDEPTLITVPAPAIVDFACTVGNNQNDARLSINTSGITGGGSNYVRYEFINDQGTAATGDDLVVQDGSAATYTETNIAGGSYIINVYDDRGCLGSTTAIIAPFVEISNPTVAITQEITCNPGDDAQVTIGYTATPATPVPTITYSVVGTDNAYSSLNQPTAIFNGLGIGNYEVTVTNTNTSCAIQTVFEIEDPNTFEIATTVTDVVCFGDDGSVSFTISDTINPYAGGFAWQIYESQGTDDVLDDIIVAGATGVSANLGPTAPFGIGAGEYRVEITQDSDPSCVNNARFTIAGPSAAVTANIAVTPITCVGNDGVIEIIDVLGGWGDYQYYVGTVPPVDATAYGTNPRFENLAPDNYQAWVIDRDGCQTEVQNPIVLADPTLIAATLQLNQPNCPSFSGEIQVVGVTGGQNIPANYSYQLQVLNTTTSLFEDLRPIQNSDVFSGLGAGVYQVIVSDQWSCTFTTATQLLYEPIVPLATVVKTIDCTTDAGGQITITQTGGSGNFDYEVRYPGTLATDPADGTNTTGVFTTLTLVGDYIFTITDQVAGHACPVTTTQNLQDRVLPVLTIDNATNITCNSADDGTISVSVTDNGVGPYQFRIIAGNGSSPGTPILPTSSTSTSAVFTGLVGTTAGITYTIEARGSNNCFVTADQVITQPELIANVNATVVEFACTAGNNSNNATITIDTGITGGSGTYVRYEFINTDTATTVQDGTNNSYTETNFAGGNYTINVYDDVGCIGSTTASITPFDELQTATVVVIDPISCVNGGEDIRIDVVGSLSDSSANPANFEYRLLPGGAFQASNLFNDLAAGSHAFEIRNVNTLCVISTTHFIAEPNTFDIVVDKISNVQCYGGNGQVQFSITDATYTGGFVWMIFNDNGTPADRTDDGPFILDGNSPNLGPTGSIDVPAGTYVVEIIQNGFPQCTQTEVFTITTPPAALTVAVNEESSPSCSDDQGRILVTPSGGQGPYTILLENAVAAFSETQTDVSAHIFSGLAGGDYNVTVTDALGCVETGTITLVTPQALTATISNTDLVCFNGTNASVTATVGPRNVTPPYLYQLLTYDDAAGTNLLSTSSTQTADNFQNLPAGFYGIRVTDDIGCEAFTAIQEISNPTEVTALLVRTSPLTCLTGVELQLSATGGLSGTYEYSADNITWTSMPGNSVNILEPVAGTYRFYVRDALHGCAAVLSNEITEDPIVDPALSAPVIVNVACTGESTGSISTQASGGLGDYRYSLFTDAGLTNNYYSAGHSQATGQFNGLPAAIYYVEVVSSDCRVSIQAEITEEPLGVAFNSVSTDVTCAGEDNGTITVGNNGGGTGLYQYAITDPNGTDLKQFTELLPGATYVYSDLEGSVAGTVYRIIAQDSNGCFEDFTITIYEPEPLGLTTATTAVACTDDTNGTITLTITGGTAPFTAALNSTNDADYIPVTDGHIFTGLASGFYEVRVKDAGCNPVAAVAEVGVGVNLNAKIEPVYICNGNTLSNYINITLVDSSVLGDVMYALDSSDPVNASDLQLNPDFRDMSAGQHTITIVHSNGCEKRIDFEIENFQPLGLTLQNNTINVITAEATGGKEEYTFFFNDIDNGSDNTYVINQSGTYTVRVVDANGCEVIQTIEMEFIDIEIPNFFTPSDGNGLNDLWMPQNIESWPQILIKIYDRYGRVVSNLEVNSQGWDGTYKQKELPSGDYWYVIKLQGENDPREFVGHFTLYR